MRCQTPLAGSDGSRSPYMRQAGRRGPEAPGASELILPLTMAVQRGLTVNDLAGTIAVYPSLSGSVTEAARRLMHHDDLD